MPEGKKTLKKSQMGEKVNVELRQTLCTQGDSCVCYSQKIIPVHSIKIFMAVHPTTWNSYLTSTWGEDIKG